MAGPRRRPDRRGRTTLTGPFVFAPAYIGPGAGFAFFGSFLGLAASFFLTAASFVLWPFRAAWKLLGRKRGFRNARIQRLIFLGLDGLIRASPSASWPKANCPTWPG